jgi:N-methylhydantoinase A
VNSLIVGIDVGGTFTDFVVIRDDPAAVFLWKRPSNPADPAQAIIDGLGEALNHHGLAAGDIARLAHGTTVGTNALIERRTGTVAVVTTDGFRDLLEIGRQTRPRIYDIHLDNPPPLVPRHLRHEVKERMLASGDVLRALEEEGVARVGGRLKNAAVDCVVVCFLHSHQYPQHENRAAEILRATLGKRIQVICSSAVYPEFREYERFSTAVLNGALLTVMRDYLERLRSGTAACGVPVETLVSQSAGGLLSLAEACDFPIRTALSGPAAGVIGAAHRAAAAGFPDIITIDVGGTSTDVSLVTGGEITRASGRQLAGLPLRLPTIDVNAVGAGGGSIASIDRDGLLKVGPRSAGAEPGPICYGRGGTDVTVTDANVTLGRLPADALLGGRMPIQARAARDAIAALAATLGLSPSDTALGILRVATANMVRAIRTISVERGHRPGDFALFAYGGAGPLHACDVARELEMTSIVVPPRPGLLCADGLLVSDLESNSVVSIVERLSADTAAALTRARDALQLRAQDWFAVQKIDAADRALRWTAELRYVGQNFELAVPLADTPFTRCSIEELGRAFQRLHEQSYGYAFDAEPIEIVNLKLTAIGRLSRPAKIEFPQCAPGSPTSHRDVTFGTVGALNTPVFRRDDLAPGQVITGPAIIEQTDTTTVVFPADTAVTDSHGNLIITID